MTETPIREVLPIVERGIEQAIAYFNSGRFDNEQHFQEFLYYILADELQKSNSLFGKTRDGKSIILLIREKITKSRYIHTGTKPTYARLDIALLDPEILKSMDFPKNSSDLWDTPLAVGIEIKINKTDRGWNEEMDYLYEKLKGEVPRQDGQYIMFLLAPHRIFLFERDYKAWLEQHKDIKVRSNKKELSNL